MGIHEINSVQASFEHTRRVVVSGREDASSLSVSTSIPCNDDASGIRKADKLADQALQVEKSQELTIVLDLLDTPENILLAAKSILKYGI